MEWIQANIGWVIAVVGAAVTGVSWLIRLESRVNSNTASIERLNGVLTGHLDNDDKHTNGKAIQRVESEVRDLKKDLVDTRKSLETKIDDLFNKLYDQK